MHHNYLKSKPFTVDGVSYVACRFPDYPEDAWTQRTDTADMDRSELVDIPENIEWPKQPAAGFDFEAQEHYQAEEEAIAPRTAELELVPVFPSIHSNGSGKQNLLDEYFKAMQALTQAVDALPRANARDYYPQGEGTILAAHQQAIRWRKKLHSVFLELEQIAEKISDQ